MSITFLGPDFAAPSDIAFVHYPKIPRADKLTCYISEKIDGTNAQILISAMNEVTWVRAGSRNRWLQASSNAADDNFGFARWVAENAVLLARLGPGTHYGEWWGAGIGRHYGQSGRFFSLFDTKHWGDGRELAARGLDAIGVRVVPMLAACSIEKLTGTMEYVERKLREGGSVACPGWNQPEGYVVRLPNDVLFKVTDNGNKSKFQIVSETCASKVLLPVAAPPPSEMPSSPEV